MDWLSHFLAYADDHDQARDWFTQLVEEVDEYCGELAADADNVMIVSDHGFEEKNYTVHINDLLTDQGYLAEPGRDGTPSLVDMVYAITKHSGIARRGAKLIYDRLTAIDSGVSDTVADATSLDVDYAKSQAWDVRNGCVFLNDQRFVSPTVTQPDQLADDISQAIREVTLPNGNPAFQSVLKSKDVYSNPSGMVPNIVARPAQGVNIATTRSSEAGHVSRASDFDHRYDGIIGGVGSLFETGTVEGMRLIDVLPTILHALDHGVPDSLDGEVKSELLSTTRSVETMTDVPEARTERVDSSDDVVEERLADLGYI